MILEIYLQVITFNENSSLIYRITVQDTSIFILGGFGFLSKSGFRIMSSGTIEMRSDVFFIRGNHADSDSRHRVYNASTKEIKKLYESIVSALGEIAEHLSKTKNKPYILTLSSENTFSIGEA